MSFRSRVTYLRDRIFRTRYLENDLDEEVRAFLDVRIERRIANGVPPAEARRQERLASSTPEAIKERVREARLGFQLETTLEDIRYGWRALRKRPGFSITAILSLGLGLGANTAIFTLVNTVILKSLPVKRPERLVLLDKSDGRAGGGRGAPA